MAGRSGGNKESITNIIRTLLKDELNVLSTNQKIKLIAMLSAEIEKGRAERKERKHEREVKRREKELVAAKKIQQDAYQL